ncbi:histone H1A, sperm-like [Lineus longissimus]|uniref:histone H1A, sperm-like n=1 Tax=Lineus longissimus TaxID=88925 RepID=UPI00315DD046
MSDAAAPAPAKAKKATKPRKQKVAASHPPVAQMVDAAIKNLKDRKGSSLAAIKKYVAANYKCDTVKLAPFIRRYLKKAVGDGKLVQTKGTGAAGSFKLPSKEKAEKPKVKKVKKPKAAVKKAKSPKKAKKPKAAKPPKKVKKAAKSKKTSKAAKPTKAKKSPAKKPATKKPAAKKAAKK